MSIHQPKLLLLVLLFLSWLPSTGAIQVLSYISPMLLAPLLICLGARLDLRAVLTAFFILAFILLSSIFNTNDFYFYNFALAILTHSPWLFLLFQLQNSPDLTVWATNVVARISILQFFLGVAQFLASTGGAFTFNSMASGDAVVGTLLDNSHLFAAKMMISALFLGVCIFRGDKRILIRLGFFASIMGAVLASALLTTTIFVAAVSVYFLFIPSSFFYGHRRSRILRTRFAITLSIIFTIAFFYFTQRENFLFIANYSSVAMEALKGNRQFGVNKAIVAVNSAKLLLENPEKLLTGYGFGHYSSRAALILSGGYLRNHPSYLPVEMSKLTEQYVYPFWNRETWSKSHQDGVMNQPFFSLQSILIETGVPGILIIFFIITRCYRAASKSLSANHKITVNYFILPLCFFLPFLLLTENWIEYPHIAIQISALILLARAERRGACVPYKL